MGLRRGGLHRFGAALGLLIALAAPAAAQRERVLDANGPHRLIVRETSDGEEALIAANQGARRQALANDRRFDVVQSVTLGDAPGLVVRGWSGGAYCCFTLHVFQRTPRGHVLAGSFSTGKAEEARLLPDGAIFWVPDGAFDFWDVGAGRATDLAPPIALRLSRGRLRADAEAMRRPIEDALGRACTQRGQMADRRVPHFTSIEAALLELPAGRWGTSPGGEVWRPEAELPRRALCLLYAGHGDAALAMMAAWPAAQAHREPALRQLRARLLCDTTALPVLRALNPGHPWLLGECMTAMRDDSIALSSLN